MAALALALAAGCQRAAPVAPDAPPQSAHALADDSTEGAQVHAERTSGQDRPPGQSAAPLGHTPRAGDRTVARQTLMVSITIFVLSIFVGVELITKVPATLHTPLMSGSNAISGITVVGGLIAAGGVGWVACSLGFLAVVLAAINVVGGFLVTHRMLRMFDRR
jgi:NAD(P) transhydrogenase subunit alpha